MERFCRECGEPLSGRSDKQFCCPECRTAYHNRGYTSDNIATNAVNRILRYNRRLLAQLYRAGVRNLSLADERLMGYNLHYYTSVDRHLLRPAKYHCYEFSYCIVRGRMRGIKKRGGARE